MKTKNYPIPLLVLALTLAGCATPPAGPARLDLPAHWQQTPSVAPVGVDRWWEGFGDPQLDRLIERVLAGNNDLARAALKVEQARVTAGLADLDRLPSLSSRLNASSSRPLDSGGASTRSFGSNASVAWELDLWGRLADAAASARWSASATEADRAGVRLSLIANTAALYWKRATLDRQYALAQASLDYARQTLKLVEAQYRAGSVSRLELASAQQSVASQEASLAQLEQSRTENRHALALLLDAPPQADPLDAPARLPAGALPEVPAGLPSGLLARRPDVRAAMARLEAAYSDSAVARKNWLPSLPLTGSFGTGSGELASLLSNPVGTLGAGVLLPFLDAPRLAKKQQLSELAYRDTVVSYRQTVYTALAEVENALSARRQLQLEGEARERALVEARRVERLNEVRYRAGSQPLQSWIDAQERRRAAELAALQNRQSQLENLATLHKALGGGLEEAAPTGA